MTAENERSDQSDAHKHSLAKQRQPGMIRALFVPNPTRCYPGNAGTKIAANGIPSSAVALSQMIAERP